MKWEHQTSTDWLLARKEAITATELISLIPDYKRWRKAGGMGIAPAFAALWAEKVSTSIPDPMSYGDAARGHIMEPYAVEQYVNNTGEFFYHWDDCIIINGGAGFSPDALDTPQPDGFVKLYIDGDMIIDENNEVEGIKPSAMLEIKSYQPKHHIKNMLALPDELPERMQIAHAMMVCPSIEVGTLVFFCPSLERFSMFTREYTRDDLKEEIELCQDILSLWNKTVIEMKKLPQMMTSKITEEEIYNEYVATQNEFII